jgi:hypothetical protein
MKSNIGNVVKISQFIETHKKDKINFNVAFKLSKIANSISSDMNFFREKYQEILDECAEKDEKGAFVTTKDNIKLREDKITIYIQKENELFNCETDLPDDITFSPQDFENMQITIEELQPFSVFIKE